ALPILRYTLLDEEVLGEYPNIIVVKSISKSYGVPGLRLGVLASADADLISRIQKKTAIWNINSFGEFFLQIVDKYKKLYVAACNGIAAGRARFIRQLADVPGLTVFPSQANYVLCHLEGAMTSAELAEVLLDRCNIFIKDLSTKKGFGGGNWIRLVIRGDEDNAKLVAALKAVLP
ncbi:MAG: aminotransferase class I/II-fold pyridoxal phosphate-dependent enzyme, partial [Eggerthellaceae bacterium]|nr:aminotransferase class I/II-fold pyridoxal phosphate-dependent enzyme [Eggerthellaceae bacterium]